MSGERRLLFFGELPPDSIHGIAISNHLNLGWLKSSFSVETIKEYDLLSEHDKISIHKFAKRLKNLFQVFSKSVYRHYDYFYLNYSLSFLGGIKTLLLILSFRISNRGKVVLHIHRGDFFKKYYKLFFNRIISYMIFSLTQKIIVLSNSQKSEFETIYKKTFFVLYNTVEFEFNNPNILRGNNKFIYVSNYLIDKGIIDLLEVFSRLIKMFPGTKLTTYGAFSDTELQEDILKFSSDNICINGMIKGREKFNEIANSDCLILPSWNEGQPTVLLEAMSVGTPVIATQTGLIPDILGEDYPFISIPGDRFSLKSKIIEFMQHEDISHFSNVLYERYIESYSQDKHIEMLKNIFE